MRQRRATSRQASANTAGRGRAGRSELSRWWHRDHPEASAIGGFFCGVLAATVVPGAYVALLGLLFDLQTTQRLFPFVLVVLAVPLGLLVRPRTRRFGRYLLLGIVLTVLVVLGVTAAVLWYLVQGESG